MGLAKREMERLEDLDWAARRILSDVGSVKLDSNTDEAVYQYDPEADRHAYARAMTLRRLGKLDGTTLEVREAIKRAIDEAF